MNARWKSLLCFALFIVVHYTTFASDGYKIKTVVIDAGHGGKDPGALGQAKNFEKDIALVVALKLGDYITRNFPDITVIYTRKTDVFIALHERAEIANRAKADLFISIHCNSSTNKEVYGTSTYVLGLHRTEANLEVSKRENAVIELEDNRDKHYDFDPNSPEGHIIMSMKQNAFLDQSISCAQHAEEQMESYGKRKSLGVKQAGFYVLYKTAMPSLLCEIGFISNKEEEVFLASTKGQDYTATSLYNAFRVYKDQMEKDGGKLTNINTSPDTETEKQNTASQETTKKPVDSNVGAGGKMKEPFSNPAEAEAAAKVEADRKAAEQAAANAKAKSEADAKAKADAAAKAEADRITAANAAAKKKADEDAAKAAAVAKAEEDRKKNEAEKMSAPTATISDTQTVKGGGYNVTPRDKEEEERLAAKAAADAKARAEAQKAAADAEAERVANEQAAKKKAQEEATAKADAKAKADAAAEADRVTVANAAAKKKADEQAAAQAKADAAAKTKADADAKTKADAAAKSEADRIATAAAAQKKADEQAAAQAKAKADADAKADAEVKAKADAAAKAEAAQRDKEAERKAKITTTLKNEVVIFRIQICALQNPFQNFEATQKKLGYIDKEPLPNGLTRYLTGNYKTYEEAMKHLPFVHKEGYKEAFIIAYNDGERLDIKQTNDFRMHEEAKKKAGK